jgi:uncharacterized protein (DUF2345 family)
MKVCSKSSVSNCACKGLGLLGGEGASLNVDGSKVEVDKDGKLTHKKEYVRV